jgi:hypothetical protein
VHGTWGRGFVAHEAKAGEPPRWFEQGSGFRTRLEAAFHGKPPRIETLLWSGSNSIVARDEAGQALADLLRTQRRTLPNAKQLVIAHSHGGNVALRAIDYLGDEGDGVRIASLATPFFEIFPPAADFLPYVRYAFTILTMMGVTACLYLLSMAYQPRWTGKGVLFAATLALAVAVVRELRLRMGRRKRLKTSFEDEMARRSSHGAFEKSTADLLVLRAVDDEAALALAAGAVSSWIARIIFTRAVYLAQPPAWLIWTAVIGFAVLALLWPSIGPSLELPEFFERHYEYVIAVFFLPLELLWLGVAFSTICDAVYGRELFCRFMGGEISTSSVPDSNRGVTVHTLIFGERSPLTKRHNIYDHPACPSRIVEWAEHSFAHRRHLFEGDDRRNKRGIGAVTS